jgi:hypothetical protein
MIASLAIHTGQVYCLPIEGVAADAGQDDHLAVRTLEDSCMSLSFPFEVDIC